MLILILQGAWVCALGCGVAEVVGILRRAGQPRTVAKHLAILVGFGALWWVASYAVPLGIHQDNVTQLTPAGQFLKGASTRAWVSLLLGAGEVARWKIVLLIRSQLLFVPVLAYGLALLLLAKPRPDSPEPAPADASEPRTSSPAFWAALLLVAQPTWYIPHVIVEYYAFYGAAVVLLLLGVHGMVRRPGLYPTALSLSSLILIGTMRPESGVIATPIAGILVIHALRRRSYAIACVGIVVGAFLAWYAIDAVHYIMHQARTEPLSIGAHTRHELADAPWYAVLRAWLANVLRLLPRNVLFLVIWQHVWLLGFALWGVQLVRTRRLEMPALVAAVFPLFYLVAVLGKEVGFNEPVKYHALVIVSLWYLAVTYARAHRDLLVVRIGITIAFILAGAACSYPLVLWWLNR